MAKSCKIVRVKGKGTRCKCGGKFAKMSRCK